MRTISVIVFAVLIIISLAPQAKAIPAWGSRYGMDCNSCHVNNLWPRLNRQGYEFKLRGYRFSFEKVDRLDNFSDAVSVVYNFTNSQARLPGNSRKSKTDYEESDLFATTNFGSKSQFAVFSEVVPNEVIRGVFGLHRHTRWFKAGNLTWTGGNEKNTFQVRSGRLPQIRGSLFMGNDRYPSSRTFVQDESVRGHKFGQNYGLGVETLWTHNMKTTLRGFVTRVDETSGYNDARTYGGAVQRLFGNDGNSSLAATFVHSDQPHRTTGLEADVDRVYLTGSLDVSPKLLFVGGLAGGSSTGVDGVRRTDLGWFGEVDCLAWSPVTFVTRYDELDVDWNSNMPKRGVSVGAFSTFFSRQNFQLGAFAEYGKVFNTSNGNKQVIKSGVRASF